MPLSSNQQGLASTPPYIQHALRRRNQVGDMMATSSPSEEPPRGSPNRSRAMTSESWQRRRESPVSSVISSKKKLSRRSPAARYLVLSLVLMVGGLAVRYFWRQLAGLAGALLILSAASRWTGKREASAPALAQASENTTATTAAAAVVPHPGGVSNQRNSEGSCSSSTCNAETNNSTSTCTDINVLSAGSTGTPRGRGDAPVLGAAAVAATSVSGGGGDYLKVKDKEEWEAAFAGSPSELRRYWEDGGSQCPFVVRGPNYMSDKKKIPAGPAAMRLVHVDFFALESEVFHVASKGRCRDRISAFVKSFESRGEKAPFLFILNILLPGIPVVSTVMYWAMDVERKAPSEEGLGSHAPFLEVLKRYAEVPGSGYSKLDRVRSVSREAPTSSMPSSANHTSQERVGVRIAPTDDVVGISGNSNGNGSASGDLAAEKSGNISKRSERMGSDPARIKEGGCVDAPPERGGPRSTNDGLLPVEDFRNQRFKLIPSIVTGPFIVRKAVGNKPALLGRKLDQRYFRGADYMETDVDVGSSMVAEKIVSLCRGYARSLIVELGICLEGRCNEELPEKCIGVIRLINLDLEGAEPLEDPNPKDPQTPPAEVPPRSERQASLEGGDWQQGAEAGVVSGEPGASLVHPPPLIPLAVTKRAAAVSAKT